MISPPDSRAGVSLQETGALRRPRVLHVITGLMTGGAERALVQVSTGLRELGVTSSVIAFRDGPVGEELQRHGIETTIIDPASPGAFLRQVRRLKQLPEELRPTIVQGWMYHANLAGLAFGRLLGVPVSWGIRQNIGVRGHDKLLTRIVIRAGAHLSRFAEATIFNSESCMRQHLNHGFSGRGAAVVPNGFDTVTFAPIPEHRSAIRKELQIPQSAFVIGHVARYHSVKNQAMFVRVARRVLGQRSDAHALMVGNGVGGGETTVTRAIRGEEHVSRFHLLGERRDINRLFCAMDVVCLTSWSESFPNVVGEAMASGVPCVTTDVGDVREIIGALGEIVAADDSDSMASAVLNIASLDLAERSAIAEKCRERIVRNYSASRAALAYLQLYRGLSKAELKSSGRQAAE